MTGWPFVVGLSHHTAPVAVRESLAVSPEEARDLLRRLQGTLGLAEVMVLSTCNRFEVYGVGGPDGADAVAALLAERLGGARSDPVYRLSGEEAVRHAIRVAAGLDSQVVGEPQVLGQVKDAYRMAEEGGFLGPVLSALRHRTFTAAKRIRTETGIGRHAGSVPHAAVELAGKVFGHLGGRRILLVGAGRMCRLAARRLVKEGASIAVAGRTLSRAEALARPLGGRGVEWSALPQELPLADVVLTGTGARSVILTRETLAEVLRLRRGRPLVVVDMALPRNVEPSARSLGGLFLYDLDGLEEVVGANMAARRQEATAAERLVHREARAFRDTLAGLDVAPLLAELHRRGAEIRRQEMRRVRRRMGALTPEQEEALETLGASLVEKLLRAPTKALAARARAGGLGDEAGLVKDLLGLS